MKQDYFLVSSILGATNTIVESINYISPSPLVDQARAWLRVNEKTEEGNLVEEVVDDRQHECSDTVSKLADDPLVDQCAHTAPAANKETRKVSHLCKVWLFMTTV